MIAMKISILKASNADSHADHRALVKEGLGSIFQVIQAEENTAYSGSLNRPFLNRRSIDVVN